MKVSRLGPAVAGIHCGFARAYAHTSEKALTRQADGRRRPIEVFCDAYGIAVPEDLTGRAAWQQRLVMQTCEALAGHGIEPQATWVREGHLETVRARINWTESLVLR